MTDPTRASGDPRFASADEAFADACRIWLSGCSCSSPGNPADCPECTNAFLEAVMERARDFDVATGSNTLRGPRFQIIDEVGPVPQPYQVAMIRAIEGLGRPRPGAGGPLEAGELCAALEPHIDPRPPVVDAEAVEETPVPLAEQMEQAYFDADEHGFCRPEGLCYAAEIEAVIRWIEANQMRRHGATQSAVHTLIFDLKEEAKRARGEES